MKFYCLAKYLVGFRGLVVIQKARIWNNWNKLDWNINKTGI